MFDSTKQFHVTIFSGGVKSVLCRFPTDQEWCERARQQKGIRRSLGRGKSIYEPGNLDQIDTDLLARIRVDSGETAPAIDAAEASRFIQRLERCEPADVERSGDQFRITLRVPGATVVHVLAIPVQRDVADYSGASVKVLDMRRAQQISVALEPSAALWDKVSRGVEGYSGAVPIVHKDIAIVELLAQIQALEDEADPEA